MKDLSSDLQQIKQAHLYRSRKVIESRQDAEVTVGGKTYLAFCSNDYLGLANHPEVVKAMVRGAEKYGVGSGASHLITGHCSAHHALEEELADFVNRPRTLLFSTGYMANLGVISALLRKGDAVFEDRLNHASLLDAGKLSDAKMKRYAHADSAILNDKISSFTQQHPNGETMIVSDGVFSMDGDLAPLPEIVNVSTQNKSWLMVDDAHGLGVIGNNGRGTLEQYALDHTQVPILVGTLGKAFGTFGAFVAGSEELIETLIQHARTYIYTTALPPAVAEATRTSLKLVKKETWRREKLKTLIERFRSGAHQLGLQLMESATPIQPLLIGSADNTVKISKGLWERGILVTPIRPPTVPNNTSRLRITLSALHEENHIDRLLEALSDTGNKLCGG